MLENTFFSFEQLNNLDDDVIKKEFGLRAFTLVKLKRESESIENVLVPNFGAIPISFSEELNHFFSDTQISVELFEKWFNDKEKLIHKIREGFKTKSPIIRGTSSSEGSKPLSFAGFCKSYIPKKTSWNENLKIGFWTVMNSVYAKYARYYKAVHNLDSNSNNLGLILMDFVANPLVHLTAYVFEDYYLVRGFIEPVDRFFTGGFDVSIKKGASAYEAFPNYENIDAARMWKSLLNFLDSQYGNFYDVKSAIDMEILISGNVSDFQIVPVQIRKVSSHFSSIVENASVTEKINGFDTFFTSGHLPFSIGEIVGSFITAESFCPNTTGQIVYLDHENINNTLDFLSNNIRTENKTSLVIYSHQKHDHLQYAIFEDPRFNKIFHLPDAKNVLLYIDKQVKIKSSGYSINIKRL